MKKLWLTLLLSFVSMTFAFSASLAMIDMSSPIYDYVEDLYILEGKASPMGAKPWSETDVDHLLEWITPKTEMGIELKNRIAAELSDSEKKSKLLFSTSISPQMLYHTDGDNINESVDIWTSKALDESVFNLGLGYAYSNNIALFMNVSIGTEISDLEYMNISDKDKSIAHRYVDDRLASAFTSNIPMLSGDIDFQNFPNRAYFAVGFDAFRVYSGRDRMEWGNGVMGNMLLGDTLPYHNMVSMTFTGSKWFNYQMLVDFYTPFSNLSDDTLDETGVHGVDDRKTMSGIRFMLGHRFEFSFFSGKVLFALTDAIMYYSASGYIDPQILNPMTFLHNGYIAGHSNSFAAIEFEYAPVKNFSLYAQIGIDDFAMPTEPKPPEDGSTANGLGFMGGLRFRSPSKKGYLHGNLEVVYTTPTIYHRATGTGEAGGYDFYFISSQRYKSGSIAGLYRYLSFPFGSDSIAGLLSVGYKKPGVFDITGNMFVLAHGVIDKFSRTTFYGKNNTIGDGGITSTPSTVNPFDRSETGEVEYTFIFGGDFEYTPLSWLDLNCGLYLISKANMDNIAENNQFDMQLSFGVKIHY